MAVASGANDEGQRDVPALGAGQTYTQVAARVGHAVLLRSDGTAVACGDNKQGQCDLPTPGTGQTYTQVTAGHGHTVLLRSDGTAVACGTNRCGQCDLPALDAGQTYTQVAAGARHTVLLRNDGTAVACGDNERGACELPASGAGLTYVAHLLPTLLLQVSLVGDSMRFVTLGGVERFRVRVGPADRAAVAYGHLATAHRAGGFGPDVARVDAVLPGGRLLSSVPSVETVAIAFAEPRRRSRSRRRFPPG